MKLFCVCTIIETWTCLQSGGASVQKKEENSLKKKTQLEYETLLLHLISNKSTVSPPNHIVPYILTTTNNVISAKQSDNMKMAKLRNVLKSSRWEHWQHRVNTDDNTTLCHTTATRGCIWTLFCSCWKGGLNPVQIFLPQQLNTHHYKDFIQNIIWNHLESLK